jgi:endo-1,4-beta-xylanase
MNRRSFIAGASAVTATCALKQASGLQQSLNGKPFLLKDLMSKCGGMIGTQAGRGVLNQTSAVSDYLRKNVSILTPGNDMKWSALRPSLDTFNFTDADWVVAFCQLNKIAVHGHNLCWNSENPGWVNSSVNKSNAEQLLKNHISTVAGRYRGKIDSWDVVNEPIATWYGRPDGLRNGPWLAALGPEYIDIAFHVAAENDPHAIRVLNLNHVEQAEKGVEINRQKTLELLQGMLSRNVPVQAVGLESHLSVASGTADDVVSLSRFIGQIRRMGLEIMITEIDINDSDAPMDFALRDAAVAQRYSDYLNLVLPLASPKRLIFWSLGDRGNWYDNIAALRRPDQSLHRPGLLDSAMNPKLAMTAVANSLRNNCH